MTRDIPAAEAGRDPERPILHGASAPSNIMFLPSFLRALPSRSVLRPFGACVMRGCGCGCAPCLAGGGVGAVHTKSTPPACPALPPPASSPVEGQGRGGVIRALPAGLRASSRF